MNNLKWSNVESAQSHPQPGGNSKIWFGVFVGLVALMAVFAFNSMKVPSNVTGSQQAAAVPSAGAQEVAMAVTGSSYIPNQLTIKAGMPVKWKVDGSGATGCTSVLTIPSLGITKALGRGENVIEFTAPASKGELAFMCSMGMVRGSFNVI